MRLFRPRGRKDDGPVPGSSPLARAMALYTAGRHAEAEAEARAVAAARSRPRDMYAPLASSIAALAMGAQGRHAEALAAHAAPDRFSLVLRLGVARSLNGQARHEEALAEAEHADELRQGLSEKERHPETGAVEPAMATALDGLGRATEARTRATAAHDACPAAFGSHHHRTAEARELLDGIDGT